MLIIAAQVFQCGIVSFNRRTNMADPWSISLHLEDSPNEFSWYIIFADGNSRPHSTTYFALEIRWRLRIGDAEPSSNF